MIKRILVATDGSELAQRAVKYAVELAATVKAELAALSVIDLPPVYGRQLVPGDAFPTHLMESLEDYMKQASSEIMGEIEASCAQRGVKFKSIVKTGHPVEQIVATAREIKADMVVLGSHGRSALGSVLLGSITLGVINRDIRVPVLIIR